MTAFYLTGGGGGKCSSAVNAKISKLINITVFNLKIT